VTGGRPLRVCVVLAHSVHVRNVVGSGCLDGLAGRGHELTLVVPDFARAEVERETAGWPAPPRLERLPTTGWLRNELRLWMRLASYAQRRRYRTYRHKVRERLLGVLQPRVLLMPPRRQVPWRLGRALLLLAFVAAARLRVLEPAARRLEARLAPVPAATGLIERLRPDVVFAPTRVRSDGELELLKAARRAGVPAVAFAATWDALTSKGFFPVPPDWLLVWGDENRAQAIEHHGLPPERIVVTGAPHLDVYGPDTRWEPREAFLARRGIAPDRRVILFAGTTITYWEDEPRHLRALSAAVADGELKDCVVWYRPHPRRPRAEVPDVRGLPGVVMDDQMARHKDEGASAYSARRDDLVHYRSLLEASDGLVTAFSTMIVEAALLGKPSLVIGFGDDQTGSGRLIQHANYEHSLDILQTPGITLCRSLDALKREVARVAAGEYAGHAAGLRARAGAIARNADGGARARIVAAVEAIGRGVRP
jgi:hypothetical protein